MRSIWSWGTPELIIWRHISSAFICWAPQLLCPMTIMVFTSSSNTATRRLLITLPKGWDITPPAFLIIFASPFFKPKDAGKSSVSSLRWRVFCQDTSLFRIACILHFWQMFYWTEEFHLWCSLFLFSFCFLIRCWIAMMGWWNIMRGPLKAMTSRIFCRISGL